MNTDNIDNANDIDNANEIKYDFTVKNFNTMLDTFYELKKASFTSPFFISNMKYIDFENYIESIIFKSQITLHTLDYTIGEFAIFYRNELTISYDIVNDLIKTYKYTKQNSKSNTYNTWVVFCYKYTDSYELTNI